MVSRSQQSLWTRDANALGTHEKGETPCYTKLCGCGEQCMEGIALHATVSPPLHTMPLRSHARVTGLREDTKHTGFSCVDTEMRANRFLPATAPR